MDDLYWEIFASELPGIDDLNPEYDDVNYMGNFPPCPACKSASHLCRKCKLKLLFLRRQQQKNARQSRKSHLDLFCSAESQSVSAGTSSIFLQRLPKVTVPKLAINEDQSKDPSLRHNSSLDCGHLVLTERLDSYLEYPTSADEQATIEDDSEDEDDSVETRAAYYPEPGDTDDGVFEHTVSFATPTPFCRTVWRTRQKPSFLGIQMPKTQDLQFLYDLYDVNYSKSTAYAVGAWASRHHPPLYSRVKYWMQQRGENLVGAITGILRGADSVALTGPVY